MRDAGRAPTHRIVPMGAATHLDNRGWYSELSRLSRFSPVRRTDAPGRPFIVTPTCQSDIKRTLRPQVLGPKTASPRPFRRRKRRSINTDGEQRVSGNRRVWFRNGGRSRLTLPHRHQSKIYAESNRSIFSRIFLDLTSMQTLAIYRRLLVRVDGT